MNEAGVGAGYFQCMKFSLLSVGFFGGGGGGGVGGGWAMTFPF